MKLSIVVPCYNEERNIPLILEKFAAVLFWQEQKKLRETKSFSKVENSNLIKEWEV